MIQDAAGRSPIRLNARAPEAAVEKLIKGKYITISNQKEKLDMELVDMMPVEEWVEIEKEINKRSGLNASVYDARGMRITDFKKWANLLCPSIRQTEKGLQSICSVAHQNVAAQVLKTRKTVFDECDAGLMKFAVPIFVDDEFMGVAGGCGKLRGGGRVDAYLVHRTTDLDEKVIGDLSSEIETISENRLASVAIYVEKKVHEIIEEFRVTATGGASQ